MPSRFTSGDVASIVRERERADMHTVDVHLAGVFRWSGYCRSA